MIRPQATNRDPAVGVKIAGWVERLLGGRATRWNRLVSGNSRSTWSVDVERSGGPVAVGVGVDEGNGPYSGTPLSLDREAIAYRELDGHGVAIPSFYGFDEELGALAMARVPGEPRWDDEVLAATLTEVRKLHALDVDELELPGFRRSALGDVELWAAIARERITPSSPFVDLAVDLLREHFPGEPDRLAFIHGDIGIGNVLSHEGRLTGLLDWELSHIGDPHGELAFMTVRAALHGLGIPGFGDAVRHYYAGTDVSGLDPTR